MDLVLLIYRVAYMNPCFIVFLFYPLCCIWIKDLWWNLLRERKKVKENEGK